MVQFFISAINPSNDQISPINKTKTASFGILNEAEADNLKEIHQQLISLAKMRNPVFCEGELKQLIQDFLFQKIYTSSDRPLRGLLRTLVPNSKEL